MRSHVIASPNSSFGLTGSVAFYLSPLALSPHPYCMDIGAALHSPECAMASRNTHVCIALAMQQSKSYTKQCSNTLSIEHETNNKNWKTNRKNIKTDSLSRKCVLCFVRCAHSASESSLFLLLFVFHKRCICIYMWRPLKWMQFNAWKRDERDATNRKEKKNGEEKLREYRKCFTEFRCENDNVVNSTKHENMKCEYRSFVRLCVLRAILFLFLFDLSFLSIVLDTI